MTKLSLEILLSTYMILFNRLHMFSQLHSLESVITLNDTKKHNQQY
jgi:hypothetical protein